ncbi:hypothetical protein M0805_001770 [Coniferiporia weirii]|nr:hypothetical protein M0805_001770 [Coniferiporia weirii]
MTSSATRLAKVHPTSLIGYGAGKSELYDKVRPSYAPEVLSYMRKAVKKKDNLRIVEVGCGSGIFTRALLAHPEWNSSISELKAVEPNEGMRAVFAESTKDPRVSLSDGTFDETGVPDGWADVIMAATAFHWCLDVEAATNEFVRILKPGGTVGFCWNLQDTKNCAWIQQLDDLCTPYQKTSSKDFWGDTFRRWRRMFDLPSYKASFSEPEETTVFSAEHRTLEEVVLHAYTRSGVALLSDDEKEKVGEKIKAIVLRGDGLVWVDEKEGIFEVPYATPVVIMQRKLSQ